jgi:nitrate/nitrite-specific signal transduction histidine kinase
MEDMIIKRRLSNFLLQPLVQTKIGLYCIILSLLFASVIAAIVYYNMGQLFQFIIDLTDAPNEVQDIILNHLSSIQIWIYTSLGVYILLIIAVSIWYTHRLVGPMVAFQKHFEALERGDFSHRTNLRRHDAFHDAANALNNATETLGAKSYPRTSRDSDSNTRD